MKKILFYVILCAFLPSLSNAQMNARVWPYIIIDVIDTAKVECIYKYDVRMGDEVRRNYNILQIGDKIVKSCTYAAYRKDSLGIALDNKNYPTSFLMKKTRELKKSTIYHSDNTHTSWKIFWNYPKPNKLLITDRVFTDCYKSVETPSPIDWNIDYNETKNINGYNCSKAVGKYFGREWTVWYAADIPLSYGPWMLYGLPGLILEASDSTGGHKFSVVKFSKTKQPIGLENKKAFKTSYSKVVRLHKEYVKRPLDYVNSHSGIQLKNGASAKKRRFFYNPLILLDE